jgi:diadenosine tetraphosphate (Ap4A) HIT family hydrolase
MGAISLIPRMSFTLHPRLAAGTFELGRLRGCRVLLKNQAFFPWFLVVPEVEEIEDLHELEMVEYQEVMLALREVSQFVADHFKPEKLNVGCIGNQVRQMHLHVVGRNSTDPAWPGTVWAFDGKSTYTDAQVEEIRVAAHEVLFREFNS